MAGKQTKYDISAFHALVDKIRDAGSVTLEFRDPTEAKFMRFQFYRWRKQEQALMGDPTWLVDIVVRVHQNSVVWSGNWASGTLRNALKQVGVEVEDKSDAETTS